MKKHQWVPVHRHTNPLDGGALHGGGIVDEEDTGGGCDCPPLFPHQPTTAPGVVQTIDSSTSSTLVPGADWLIGGTQFGFIARRGGGSSFVGTGWSLVQSASGGGGASHPSDLYQRTIVTGDTKAGQGGSGGWWTSAGGDTAWIVEVANAGTASFAHVDSSTGTTAFSGGSITVASGALLICGGALGIFDSVELKMTDPPVSGVTEFSNHDSGNGGNSPWLWGGYLTATSAGSAAVTGVLTGYTFFGSHLSYSAITVAVASGASSTPPEEGQWVYGEVVTLTAGVGTTAFPFDEAALHVRYDFADQTPAIVSKNGATGGFVMPSQPPLGTQVFVDYQGL